MKKLTLLTSTLATVLLAAAGDPGWVRPASCSNLVFQWDGSIDSHPGFIYDASSAGDWIFAFLGDASVGAWDTAGTHGLWSQTFVSTNTAPTRTDLNTYYVSHFNTADETGNCMKLKVMNNDPATDPLISRYQMLFTLDMSSGKDEGYMKYSMMLPGNLDTIFTFGQNWLLLAEWRYSDSDFRMGFYLSHGSCPALGIENGYFYKFQTEHTINGVTTYPVQEFFSVTDANFDLGSYQEYEFYYKLNHTWGKVWININGQKLCQYSLINTKPIGIQHDAFHCPKLYTSAAVLENAATTNTLLYEKVNVMEIYTD